MSEFQYKAGLNNVGNYQASGIPYVTSALAPVNSDPPLEVTFPSVTKFIVVKNVDSTNHPVKVGFSENGVLGTNYFTLTQYESISLDVKITKLYLVGADANTVQVNIVAGLTGIDIDRLPNSWSGSVGVG